MKLFLILIVLSIQVACTTGSDFSAPRGEVKNITLTQSYQSVSLFRVKSPLEGWWMQLSPWIFGRDGYRNNSIFLLAGNGIYNHSMASIGFDVAYNPALVRNYYNQLRDYNFISESPHLTDNYNIDIIRKNNVTCLLKKSDSAYNLICPVFFRNTFGIVEINVQSSDGYYKGTVLELQNRMKILEPVFMHMVNTLEFIEPVTQNIPANFSLDQQFKRIKDPNWKL